MDRIEADRENWILGGKDDDDSPVFIDANSITHDLDDSRIVKLWIKVVPPRTSRAFERAINALRQRGKMFSTFDHFRQTVELDTWAHRFRILHLVMCDRVNKTLEIIDFHYPEWTDIKQGGVFDMIQAVVNDLGADELTAAELSLAQPVVQPVPHGIAAPQSPEKASEPPATPLNGGPEAAREVVVVPAVHSELRLESIVQAEEPPGSGLSVDVPEEPEAAVAQGLAPERPLAPAPRPAVEPRRVVTTPIEELRYGGILQRMAASLCDFAVVIAPLYVLLYFDYVLESIMCAIILGSLYWPAFEGSSLQGTPFKRLFGLKVGDRYGEKISFERAILRHYLGLACIAPAMAGMITVFFTPKRQGLHDLATRTIVIKG